MAAVRHIGFVVTSSYCIWERYFTFLALYQIFKSIALVVSDILGLSCFIILAWNWYFGAKFDILGLNMGQMLKLNILTPKWHTQEWFRAFWAIMRQNRSKRLISARASEKKVTRKWHFTYLPRSPPWTDFYQTWNERFPHGHNQLWQILQEVKVPFFP